jgi:hypothetical protein
LVGVQASTECTDGGACEYVVALGISSLIVGASLVYHRWVTSAIIEQIKVEAGLPAGSDMSDFDIPLPRQQILHIELAQFLLKFRFVMLAVVLLICFGTAASLPRARSNAKARSNSSNK